MAYIEIENLKYRYPKTKNLALDGITLSIEKRSFVGIIGRNGSGKSTFLRCLCGLEKTCIGTVEVSGRTYHGRQMTKICYMVMQDVNHQLFTNSVLSEVLLSMEHPDEKAAEKILESLDLDEYKEKHPMALSGGQKQRLTIARALVRRPKILILDDSASALDYATDAALRRSISRLEYRPTTFIVSQRASSVLGADRVLVLEDGESVGFDTPAKLLESCEVYRQIALSQLSEKEAER